MVWSTLSLMSAKRTTASHLKSLKMVKGPQHTAMAIHVLEEVGI